MTQFGYHPHHQRLRAGPVAAEPRLDLAQAVADIEASKCVEEGWINVPPQQVRYLSRGIRDLPYRYRVCELPKKHALELAAADRVVYA